MQTVTIGRIVMFVVSQDDADKINRRRTHGSSIAARIREGKWPVGAQAHIGETVRAGDIFPALVVNVYETDLANLQVFLDGSDIFYAEMASQDDKKAKGTYHFPEFVPTKPSPNLESIYPSLSRDEAIVRSKEFRKRLDEVLQEMRFLLERMQAPHNARFAADLNQAIKQHALSIHDLESAIMRQGMMLKYTNDTNPYPNSYDATNTIVEPTADGLKM